LRAAVEVVVVDLVVVVIVGVRARGGQRRQRLQTGRVEQQPERAGRHGGQHLRGGERVDRLPLVGRGSGCVLLRRGRSRRGRVLQPGLMARLLLGGGRGRLGRRTGRARGLGRVGRRVRR